MKKLKASEITEPGNYWIFDGENYELAYWDENTIRILNTVAVPTKYNFYKAEPPKVCRWKQQKDYTYTTECGKAFHSVSPGPRDDGFVGCPYCKGDLEIEGE